MRITLTPNTTIEHKGRNAVAIIDRDEARHDHELDRELAAIVQWAKTKRLRRVNTVHKTDWRHHTLWEEGYITITTS